MRRIIFYSWQSDLPNPCNRGFIQQALENTAKAITADDSIAVEPVIDRDTQGVPGSPDIASTIFAKIVAADIFVADISITSRPKKGRQTPNPNVLIELGYAFKSLGYERVVLVFNEAFGKIEELPFDLRVRRLATYNMPVEAEERSGGRKKLEALLEVAIRAALAHIPQPKEVSLFVDTINAIEVNQPNRVLIIRRTLDEVFNRIESFQPPKHSSGGTVDGLISAINQTQETIAEFSKIASIVAAMNDSTSALEIYHWFGRIFEKYNLPENYSGPVSEADFDYFKFVGHELFVTLVAFLLREQRWNILTNILEEPIPIAYLRYDNGPANVYWNFANEHLPLLIYESEKRKRLSLHADLLNDRHTTGGLAAILPADDFIAADFFLSLRGDSVSGSGFSTDWIARSVVYLKHVPMFIRNAEQKLTADQLIKALKIPNIIEFKKRLEAAPAKGIYERAFWPIHKADIDRIGTR